MHTTRKQFLKQTSFALAGSLLPYSKMFGNYKKIPADTSHPGTCSFDLRNPIFSEAKIRDKNADDIFSYDKDEPSSRDVLYKKDEGLGCVPAPHANACNYTNGHDTDETPLRYSVSYPVSATVAEGGHDYVNYPLPALILFHAGGYSECSKFDDDMMQSLQYHLARRGFIAISVEYRTGRRTEPAFMAEQFTAQQQLAFYRGQQDGRGAIRSIMKRNTNFSNTSADYHDGKFRINPTQVFIGGASAGAALALGVAYYRNQGMINLVMLSDVTSDLTISEALGDLNVDNYFGESDGGYFPVIRGVLSCWGGILIPKEFDGIDPLDLNEYEFFEDDENGLANPPVIAFHGAADEVINFQDDDKQDKIFPSNLLYKNVSFCLKQNNIGTYRSKTQVSPDVWIKECSSLNIYNMLQSDKLNRYVELYVDCDMMHGIHPNSDFGLISPSEDDIKKYIAQRTAICFQKIMIHGLTDLYTHPVFDNDHTTYFQGCENQRKCGQIQNNTCNTDGCVIE